MPSIVDYLSDDTLLREILSNLKNHYQVDACILDSDAVPIEILGMQDVDAVNNAYEMFYPFEFPEDIGGLRCMAKGKETLQSAQSFIETALVALNSILQRELEIRQMTAEIVELSEQINFLFSLDRKARSSKRLYEFCKLSLYEIANKISADSGFVVLKDVNYADILITYQLDESLVDSLMAEEAFGISARRKEVVLSSLKDKTSVLVCPIYIKDGNIGFMAFFRDKSRRFFTAYEKKLLSIVDNNIASTIEVLRLYDNLRELYLNTVKALAAAIDAKDPYTHGHSFRVAKYSMAIAKKMGYDEERISDIEIAGYMHDIGKIGILDTVLNKAGKLTDEEYREIKRHPHLTYKILEPIKLPDSIVLPASQHHEKVDGSGYPLGLKGDEMHEFAKIIAVADVFDALTSDRIYRPAMPIEKALSIVVDGANKEFDPKVVAAFIEVLKDPASINTLKSLCPELNFTDLENFNNFLKAITERLIGSGNEFYKQLSQTNKQI